MNKLLVIIVTFNAGKWLERCFKSLESSSVQPDVMVIDNGSTDGTLKWIWDHTSDNVRIHPTGENLGFGAANNIGLRYALEQGYEYVYLLNQDAWVGPECFDRLIKAFQSSEGYGILSPLQMQADMTHRDKYFQKHCGSRIDRSLTQIVDVPCVMASHWRLTRRCIETVGGFSPAFKHYGEDENYIYRAHWHGLRSGVVMSATAVHDRAERRADKASRMRLKYVGCQAAVSDPGCPVVLTAIWQPVKIVGMAIRNMSWQMLRYLPRYFRDLDNLLNVRREGRERGAYLL